MKILDWIDRAVVLVAMVALVAMMLLTTVSVTGRYFFSRPIPDDLVLSEFLMIFVVFLPLSAVQAKREHVFVTIFTDWMTNRAKVVMETFGVIVGLVAFTIVGWASFHEVYGSWQAGSYVDGPLELPEWPPRFALFFGVALFTVRLLVDAIRSVISLRQGTAVAARSEEERALDAEIH
jgi:TRAP-type C4-dicarboxylate transport system permease small subunit